MRRPFGLPVQIKYLNGDTYYHRYLTKRMPWRPRAFAPARENIAGIKPFSAEKVAGGGECSPNPNSELPFDEHEKDASMNKVLLKCYGDRSFYHRTLRSSPLELKTRRTDPNNRFSHEPLQDEGLPDAVGHKHEERRTFSAGHIAATQDGVVGTAGRHLQDVLGLRLERARKLHVRPPKS
jgi:hypothetical protein